MTACKDCAASARELSHAFTNGCQGCVARAVARGPNFRRTQQSGLQDRQYRNELAQFNVTHEEVLAARAADWMGKSGEALL